MSIFAKKTIMPAIAVTFLLATAAYAGNVHLKPPNSSPSFTDNGLTLTAAGALAGLGNGDVFVHLDATANPTATCTNPSGQNQPPGRNPASVAVSGSTAIPASQVKNGTTPFTVTTNPPSPNPLPGAPDCPGSNWTETITDLAFTSATITVDQPEGTLVLTVSCTFNPATKDGPVDSRTVFCH
jgi:hypothetical protein